MRVFKKFVCWEASEIEHFIRREALEGEAAAFLAVHHPIRGFECVSGHVASETDEAFLSALYGARPHAIAVVEGEPGSGKSHLIQWLQHRWPRNDSDYLVLVPRSDGSLAGALERLRTELGRAYAEPLQGIGTASQLTPAGQANLLLGNLVTLCRSEVYGANRAPMHATWLDERDAWKLLNLTELRERWTAPAEVLAVINGQGGRRDQALATFGPPHIVSLINLIANVITPAGNRAEMLFRSISKELPRLREAILDVPDVERQIQRIAETAPESCKFIEALNARLNDALQAAIGVPQGELQKKFLDVRRLLRRDGKRLVLLLEDVTNLQGVDLALIEALLPNPNVEANRALCELVAVIGITPRYQSQVLEGLGNVRDRIAYHIRLTSADTAGVVDAHSIFLGEPESRLKFVGSYLNGTRLGLDRVRKWAEQSAPRPNACADCPHRESCFRWFGKVKVPNIGSAEGEDVGLYPFTAHAVERFWDRLEDPDHKRSLKTPRGLLLNVVSVVLADADALGKGEFPTTTVQHQNLRSVGVNAEVSSLQLPEAERRRLRRAIETWGDPNDGTKKTPAGGEPRYSGIPAGVASAFDLRWVDGPIPSPAESGVFAPPDEDAWNPTIREEGSPEPDAPFAPTPAPPRIPPVRPAAPPDLPPEWRKRIADLDLWMDGKDLANPSEWADLAYGAVTPIDPIALGIRRAMWDTIFTKENVTLEGVKGRVTALTFALPRQVRIQRGLTAAAWHKYADLGNAQEGLRYFAQVSAFLSYLTSLAADHVRKVEADLREDLSEPVETMAIKELVVIEMLMGAVRPDDNPLGAWGAAFAGSPGGEAGRAHPWIKLARYCRSERSDVVENAISLIRLGARAEKAGRLEGIVDGERVFGAVHDVMESPNVWTAAPRADTRDRSPWSHVVRVATVLAKDFAIAVAAEFEDIRQRCRVIDSEAGGRDSEAFLERAKRVIDGCVAIDLELIPGMVQQRWRTTMDKLGSPGSKEARALDEAIDDIGAAGSPSSVRGKLQQTFSFSKKGMLVLVQDAVVESAAAIRAAHETAGRWTSESAAVGGSGLLSETAGAIESTGQAVLNALESGRG